MVPKMRNIADEKIAKFSTDFNGVEQKAHADIVSALHEVKDAFREHNSDAHAHANLVIFAKLDEKLEQVRNEIVDLRVQLSKHATYVRKTSSSSRLARKRRGSR